MSEILPEAKYVLNQLQLGNARLGVSPEELFVSFHHDLLDVWSDTHEFVSNVEEHLVSSNRLKILVALYGMPWYIAQSRQFHKMTRQNPTALYKTRAPEGQPQWEFDLLGGKKT